MSGVHGVLGWLTLGAAVIVALAGLGAWLAGARPVGRALGVVTRAFVVVASVVAAGAVFIGGLLILIGVRPADMIHVLLGVLALAVLPVTWGLGWWADQGGSAGAGGTAGAARYPWVTGGGVLLALLAVVLIGTG